MMLTDDDLRALIESAASHAPEPSPLPAFQVEVPRVRRVRSYRPVFGVLGVVALVCLLVVGVANLSSDSTNKASNSLSATPFGPTLQGSGSTGAAGAGSAGGTGAATSDAGGSAPLAQIPPIADTAKIIKNGSLELRIGKGTVTDSVNRITALATAFGGYVSGTNTTSSAEGGLQASATISVRVPAANFEQLLTEASKVGEVRATTTSGQDVTAQFTDIDAQLTALNAARDQLLLVLGEANNVPDILSVQDRITQVQVQIDQLEGQQRLLTDQTSFGTLAVTMLEPGATTPATPVDDSQDLGDAWQKARTNFGDAVEWIVETSGTWSVVALAAAVAWLIYRRARRHLV